MFRKALPLIFLAVFANVATAQTTAPKTNSPAPTDTQTRPAVPFELSEYGVALQPDARLIIVMAALEAAGFDPTPPGKESSPFRLLVRKDQTNLDPDLRQRLKDFYQRYKLPPP